MKSSAIKRLVALLKLVAKDGSREIWVTQAGAREVLKTLK